MRNRNIHTRTCLPAQTAGRSRPTTWDELFNAFFQAPLLATPVSGLPTGRPTAAFAPLLDLTEADQEFTLTVELPGLTKEEVDLELREDALVLRGEKKPEAEADDQTVLHAERRWGSFERFLRLPADIDADGVKASFRDGVLVVRLPKAAPGGGPRKIEVHDGA